MIVGREGDLMIEEEGRGERGEGRGDDVVGSVVGVVVGRGEGKIRGIG